MFELGLYLYSFYVKVDDKTCVNKLLRAFREIYEVTYYNFTNVDSILRRFVNCFSKGFAKKESDTLQASKQEKSIKRQRLEKSYPLLNILCIYVFYFVSSYGILGTFYDQNVGESPL